MTAKLFELRDKATFIPVLAVQMTPETLADVYLLRRAGYRLEDGYPVMLTGIDGGLDKSTSDPHEWGSRTRFYAHQYIASHWNELESGAVIDVEFILHETSIPKISERETT